jgi:hypothetical protein
VWPRLDARLLHFLFAGPAFFTNTASGNAMYESYVVLWHQSKYNTWHNAMW